MEQIKVLVIDERPGLTQGMLLALPSRGPARILGPVPDVATATMAIDDGLVDVALVALDRADEQGLAIVTALRDARDTVPILVASREDAPEIASMALAAGARGVLPPDRSAHGLIDAFRRAWAGEIVLPARDLPSLVDRLRDQRSPEREDGGRLASLTGREREILSLLADGMSTRDVAGGLRISPLTVQSHVKNILSKLAVHTKMEAVRIAWRHGLTEGTRTA